MLQRIKNKGSKRSNRKDTFNSSIKLFQVPSEALAITLEENVIDQTRADPFFINDRMKAIFFSSVS